MNLSLVETIVANRHRSRYFTHMAKISSCLSITDEDGGEILIEAKQNILRNQKNDGWVSIKYFDPETGREKNKLLIVIVEE